MAGIAGAFGGEAAAAAGQALERLRHRGSGEPRLAGAGAAFLGAAGGECLLQDGIAVVLDGGLHTYERLHEELGAEGYKFRTSLHAEVILALYLDFQENTARMLDGEFAFILADADGNAYLGRDRYGIRPLYYGFDAAGRVRAASEPAALAGLVEQVRELPPGHFFHSAVGEFRYFEMPPGSACIHDPLAGMAIVRYHLEEAVGRRLPPGGPVAVFLDGGTAAAVIAGMARKLGADVELYAAGDLDEARSLAAALELPLVAVTPGPEEEAAARAIAAAALDTPAEAAAGAPPDPGLLAAATRTALLARAAARRGRTVALSSSGAAELFGDPRAQRPDPAAAHRALQELAGERHRTAFRQLDRVAAACGVEGRAPYGDPFVAIAAWEVSPTLKFRDGQPGWILGEVAARYLPAASQAH